MSSKKGHLVVHSDTPADKSGRPAERKELSRELASALFGAAQNWRTLAGKQLVERGIRTEVAAALLSIAEVGDGAKQVDVAGRMGVSAASLVRVVDSLEGLGYVRREVDEFNRRANRLWLTGKGQSFIEKIQSSLDDLNRQLLQFVDTSQISTAISTLSSIKSPPSLTRKRRLR
ncbi:hypothetical protein DKP76_04370 [Falsochrobactrum shanghaiense]|uniref:HTH marR-type domain-containing protein n=1 Tax=Falsochrobactrum shanghaiense TaxID=2201899 RepID=A0A316JCE3_9HYPH|nr:MarR family winged helix-turn-helix transcriptional regulator [Falsochrobactrum shanghaiense]PWL18345.1 hypothetical protein DKP76_04370 [Falsochrobactrum shanghaiense]